MARVLIVEDTLEYQTILKRTMSDFETTVVTTVDEAWSALRNKGFDLVLLDIELGHEKNGFHLLADVQASAEFRDIPVMCISSRHNLTDRVTAFSLGADDYILKPFDPIELRARAGSKIHRYLRRQTTAPELRAGQIEVDLVSHRVRLTDKGGTRDVEVTQTEFKLLSCLIKRPDQVFSRDQLLVAAWGENANVLERVVDVHLCSLRRKIAPYSHYVKAIPGVGYKFTLQEAARKAA